MTSGKGETFFQDYPDTTPAFTAKSFTSADASKSIQLEVNEQHVEVTTASGNYSVTLVLPNASAVRGKFFYIVLISAGASSSIVIDTSAEDSPDLVSAGITLNASGECALLYSTGRCWVPVYTKTS